MQTIDDRDDEAYNFRVLDISILDDAIKAKQLGPDLNLGDVAKEEDFKSVFKTGEALGLAATEVSQIWSQMTMCGFKQDRHGVFTLRVLVINRALQRNLAALNDATNNMVVRLNKVHKR